MSGYNIVNLKDIIDELGEDRANSILSDFSCYLNKDVEDFIKIKAIEFSKQGLSQTFLVFSSYKERQVIVGYFTLAQKTIVVFPEGLSNSLKKRIGKFFYYDKKTKSRHASAILIAQLGKNYKNSYEKLITGDVLLKMAIEKVKLVQRIIGGKLVYVECTSNPSLVNFYEKNGFYEFAQRQLEIDEKELYQERYLIQLINYLKD